MIGSSDPVAFNKIRMILQRKAKLNRVGKLLVHLFLVSTTVDLLDRDFSLERIMLRGEWKTEKIALRYLKN